MESLRLSSHECRRPLALKPLYGCGSGALFGRGLLASHPKNRLTALVLRGTSATVLLSSVRTKCSCSTSATLPRLLGWAQHLREGQCGLAVHEKLNRCAINGLYLHELPLAF